MSRRRRSRPQLLVVGPTPPPVHGTAAFVGLLLDAPQVRERFEVRHLDTSDRRGLENIGRLDPTNVVLALRHVGELAVRVRRERPDLVYLPVAQNALAYLRDGLFILAARAAGARVVTHLHVGGFGEFFRAANPVARAWIGFVQRRAHRAWVLGEALREGYAGVLPAESVRVVPNGVPDPRSGVEDRPSGGSAPPVVLFLGQLSGPKGVFDLLDAAARLRSRGLDFRLLLAGAWARPHERREAEGILRRSGLAERTALPGVLTGAAKTRVFADAAVFVLPTWYPPEAQPLAVLEAMAAGLPVVSTPRGAIPDMVRSGETGLLVPERDPAALADALAALLEDPARASQMGEAGRRRYLERFTVVRCMERIAALLEEALGCEPRDCGDGGEAGREAGRVGTSGAPR